jgi:hypothetical protein
MMYFFREVEDVLKENTGFSAEPLRVRWNLGQDLDGISADPGSAQWRAVGWGWVVVGWGGLGWGSPVRTGCGGVGLG